MKKIICFLFGHRYRLLRKITSKIREVKCIRCNLKYAMNDNTETLLPLDEEFIEMHNDLLSIQALRNVIK